MDAVTSSEHADGRDGLASSLAEQVGTLHRRRFGRAPRDVRTYLFEDLLVVVLEGFATPLEATLRDRGRVDLVTRIRETAASALEEELRAIVEQRLLRGVSACMSAVDPDADLAITLMCLQPRDPELLARVRTARRDSEALQSDSRALRAQSVQAVRHATEIVEEHSRQLAADERR